MYLLNVWCQRLISVFLPENKRVLGCNDDIHLVFRSSFHQSHQESSFLDVYLVLMVPRMWKCSLHLACTDSHIPPAVSKDSIFDLWDVLLCSPAYSCFHLFWSRHHRISRILREHWHMWGSWSGCLLCPRRDWCRLRIWTCWTSYIAHKASHHNCRSIGPLETMLWQLELGE